MRCRSCDYPLWGIVERRCPECGEGFVPSDFEFVVNAAKFCCPDCGQGYFGTGAKGHLEPMSFRCVGCGGAVSMDGMVVEPAEGVAADRAVKSGRLAWQRRADVGRLNAWWKTLGLSLGAPMRLGGLLGREPSGVAALSFLVLTAVVTAGVGVVPWGVLVGLGGGWGQGVFSALVMFVSSFVGVLAFAGLWAAVGWLVLLVTGAGQRSSGRGYGRVFESVGYGAGGIVLGVVPCCWSLTLPAIGIWWGLSTGMILSRVPGVGWWRATIVGCVAPLLGIGSIVGVAVWVMSSVYGGVQSSMAAAAQARGGSTAVLFLGELGPYSRGGAWPSHVLALSLADHSPQRFALADGWGMGSAIGVDGGRLGDWGRRADRDEALERFALAASGEAAYRVGDVVVCWNGVPVAGIDRVTGDGVVPSWADESDGLWLFLLSADPTMRSGPPSMVWVGTRGAGVLELAWGDVAGAVAAQNELRARVAGLGPLPHPDDAPAVP